MKKDSRGKGKINLIPFFPFFFISRQVKSDFEKEIFVHENDKNDGKHFLRLCSFFAHSAA